MRRCDINSVEFTPGMPYTIRSMGRNPYQPKIMSHTYIHIQATDGNHESKKCFYTFGLKSDDRKLVSPKRIGAGYGTSYVGTLLQAPDFADLQCASRLTKCKSQNQSKGRDGSECGALCSAKGFSLLMQQQNDGDAANQNKYVFYGNIMGSGFLNDTQCNILNAFKEKSITQERGETKWKEYKMPFTFSFLAACPTPVDWREAEYYNCQKFAQVFHTKPAQIWKYMHQEAAEADNSIPPVEKLLGSALSSLDKLLKQHNNASSSSSSGLQFNLRQICEILLCLRNSSMRLQETLFENSQLSADIISSSSGNGAKIPESVIRQIAVVMLFVTLVNFFNTHNESGVRLVPPILSDFYNFNSSAVAASDVIDREESQVWVEIIPEFLDSCGDILSLSGDYSDDFMADDYSIGNAAKMQLVLKQIVSQYPERLQNVAMAIAQSAISSSSSTP